MPTPSTEAFLFPVRPRVRPAQTPGNTPGRRLLAAAMTLLVLCGSGLISGCTLPSDHGDLDYPTYGGRWQRTRRDGGRVGSVFDPAGARTATLTDRDTPGEDDDEPSEAAAGRSSREGILSTPPVQPGAGGARANGGDEESPTPSPSDRRQLDRERLRSLNLDEINITPGPPAPPQLH